MMISELHKLIIDHGVSLSNTRTTIGGCELLEYVSDVEGFVELLREFAFRNHGVSFVVNYPDPINAILGGGVRFCVNRALGFNAVVIDVNYGYYSYYGGENDYWWPL